MRVLLKAGPCPTAQGILHGPRPGGPAAHGPRPKEHFTAHGPVARFTVHIPWSSLEFFSAVFYSACYDLCSEIEVGFFAISIASIPCNPCIFLLLFAQGTNVRSLL